MNTLIFRLLLGAVCILGLVWLASCSDTVEPGGEMESGSEVMNMSMNLQPLSEAGLAVTRVHVLIQKGAFSREMELEIDGEMATGVFEGLTPGIYEIFVNMYEGESLIATGTGEGVVVAGQTTTATIQMEIANGNLEVIVEWGPASADVLLEDEFLSLDESTWIVGSNGGGAVSLADGVLEIRSGRQDGGGTWIQTREEYLLAEDQILRFECTCYADGPTVGRNDMSHWGLFQISTTPNSFVGFQVLHDQEGLVATVVGEEGMYHQPIGGVDYTIAHDYSLQMSHDAVTFFVDGAHVATIATTAVPSDYPLSVRLDKSSPGQDTYMYVDSTRLSVRAGETGCTRTTIVDFTPFSTEIKWIEINDRDPVGLPLLRWQYEISDIPANPTLSFDYAGAETEFTGIWLWDEFLSYLPATGGDETFQHFEMNIDPSLLVVGKNYIGFVSGYIPSQGEADGVLFKNVKLGDIDFTPFAPNVDWVECNDRDPVGLPFLRWHFTLSSNPENPSLVFEYAGAETDETQFWVGESRIAYLPETGGDEEFSSYEIDIAPALLKIGTNQLGFISGYIPSQNEADGILFREVRLIGGEK